MMSSKSLVTRSGEWASVASHRCGDGSRKLKPQQRNVYGCLGCHEGNCCVLKLIKKGGRVETEILEKKPSEYAEFLGHGRSISDDLEEGEVSDGMEGDGELTVEGEQNVDDKVSGKKRKLPKTDQNNAQTPPTATAKGDIELERVAPPKSKRRKLNPQANEFYARDDIDVEEFLSFMPDADKPQSSGVANEVTHVNLIPPGINSKSIKSKALRLPRPKGIVTKGGTKKKLRRLVSSETLFHP